MKVEINDKEYNLKEATTTEEMQKGLMGVTELPEDEGMIFIYPEEKDLTFWMHETPIKLDIICVGEDLIVNQVTEGQANDDTPIKMYGKYVIELNANSGVKEGDEVDLDDDEDINDFKSKSKMLVLDENGEVQMELEGGERIFSRIATKKFIKLAIKAWKNKKNPELFDKICKKLGKALFLELDGQTSRDPEYVELHTSNDSSKNEKE